MSVKINMKNQNPTAVFEKLCPPGEAETLSAFKKAVNQGAIGVETGFWAITLEFPHTNAEKMGINLPVSVSQIMKGQADTAQVALASNAVAELMKAGLKAVGTVPVKPVEQFEAELSGSDAPVAPAVPKPKNMIGGSASAQAKYDKLKQQGQAKKFLEGLNLPVKLRDAKDLGQAVFGTSKGSVYWTIAVSERVKIAARVQGTSISIRAEGEPIGTEIAALKASGLTPASEGHYSMHLEAGQVPVARVLGAFLLGVGIPFDVQVTHAGQIKVS